MRFSFRCDDHGSHDVWASGQHTLSHVLTTLNMPCLTIASAQWHVGKVLIDETTSLSSTAIREGALLTPLPCAPEPEVITHQWAWSRLHGPSSGACVPAAMFPHPPHPNGPPVTLVVNHRGLRAQARSAAHPVVLFSSRPTKKNPQRFTRHIMKSGPRPIRNSDVIAIPGPTFWRLIRVDGSQKNSAKKDIRPGQKRRRLSASMLIPVGVAAVMSTAMWARFHNPWFALIPMFSVVGGLLTAVFHHRERLIRDFAIDASTILCDSHRSPHNRQNATSHDLLGFTPANFVKIMGPAPVAQACARTLVVAAAVDTAPPKLTVPRSPQWAWTRWLPTNPQASRALVITDGPADTSDPTALTFAIPGDSTPVSTPAATGHVNIVPRPAPMRVEVARNHAEPQPAHFFGMAEAENIARRLAVRSAVFPEEANIAGLLPYAGCQERWGAYRKRCGAGQGGLPAIPIGTDASGNTIMFDLAQHGPHALIGGATGSGKSEFLRTVVLGCALSVPPDLLTIIGVDHKGGATFSELRALPHVADVLTDLDIAGTRRAIDSLEAEIRRREGQLADHGAPTIDSAASMGLILPRVLVVIDEFRELAQASPETMTSLVTIAAHGRSLGIHLIVATQRPGGVVTSQMRANLPLRVCFRVAGPSDSTDLIGVADAASISPDAPGAAIFAGSGDIKSFQALLACPPPAPEPCLLEWPDAWEPPDQKPAAVSQKNAHVSPSSALVAHIADAATTARIPNSSPLWLPPLPTRLTREDLEKTPECEPWPELPLALADKPEDLRQYAIGPNRTAGSFLIIGGPSSGKTTALKTLAVAALDQGLDVHVAALSTTAFTDVGRDRAVSTCASFDNPRGLARLFRFLANADANTVLLIDDADRLLAATSPVRETLEMLISAPTGHGPWVALSGPPALGGGRLASAFAEKLILPVSNPADSLVLGLDRALMGSLTTPGRGVWMTRTGSCLCHVAVLPRENYSPAE